LRKAAFLDAAVAGQGAQALFFEDLAGGVIMKSFTWAIVAAPTKPVSSLNCGQTSMQQQQEMQLDSG